MEGGINIKNIAFPVDDDDYAKLTMLRVKKNQTLKDYMIDVVKEHLKQQEDKE
jgi:hypothetical protein